MPTITAIAWERLLDRSSTCDPPSSSKKPSPPPPTAAQLYFISPSLYAARDASLIPDSSPSSPYVINRKRRDLVPAGSVVVEEGGGGVGCCDAGLDSGRGGEGLEDEGVGDNLDEDFFDPRESMSVSSCSEVEDGGSLLESMSWGRTSLTNQSEFYDAATDFSDGSVSHASSSINTSNKIELHAVRHNLLEEIDKRKRAEEALLHMQGQWQRMARSLHQVGFSFPETQHSENVHQRDPVELCQEIVVTKFVLEALESSIARAETEAILEAVLESKNHDISRLRDRLQYYEAMNREMSQRNQEVVVAAQQQHLRRRTRGRWIWSCVGLSITVGAALLAYSHLSDSGKTPSPASFADSPSIATDAGGTEVFLAE